MTFFYNLNDKLNAIREKPETTHGQLNERDMGKHNNKTTGFDALAKKAGKEYGSKAAGERVAGAQFQKMKKSGKLEEQGQLNELSTDLLKRARDKAGMKYADADDRKDKKASAKHNAQDDKFNSALRKKQKDMDEGMGDVAKRVGSAVKKVGGAVLNKLGHGDDQAMRKDLQRKMGMPQTGKKPQELDELSPATLTSYAGKRAGQGTWAGGVAKGLAGRPAERDGYADSHWTDPKVNYGSEGEKYAKFNQKALGNIKKAHAKGATPNNQSYDWGKEGGYGDASNPVTRKKGMAEEGGAPMTAKQKSFAKLAPPKDKITFADKIAGAKKEVDEMLGDVAAEAIKSALSPKQKKIDMNKNGKLDTNDFAMLRKGGNKQVADEGWDEMEKDVKSRMGARKVGDVTHGDKHDTQEIPGGRRVTRRVDPNTGYSVGADSDEPTAGEKRGRGRPKSAGGPRQERVTAKSRKADRTVYQKKTNEGDLDITDRGEYDQEGDMAKDSIKTVVRHAQALEKILGDNDNLPEWVQSKLAKIESMMTAVDDYMQNQEDDEEMAMGEEKTEESGLHWLRGDHKNPETAGKKVTKDIEYDEKKTDGIQSFAQRLRSEDDRAERAGKKVTKDIEYDDKKDKPKKVKEQGGTDTPTASSGFSYGKGIYDSMNRELEGMISESKNISMSMNTDATGGPSRSVTVTATDDDAMKLGELLKNAGLGGDYDMGGQTPGTEIEVHGAEDVADKIRQAIDGDHGHDDGEVCDACGQADCGCETVDEAYGDDVVDQNSPDYPTNTETAQDSFEYSGGLNGPKSTGQTTIPVIASQEDRQHTYENDQELRRMMEMAGVKKKEVDEEKTEEGNLFTKGLADDDVKVGEKIPGTDAVKKKDIDEGILASTASLWKQYKGQYGV